MRKRSVRYPSLGLLAAWAVLGWACGASEEMSGGGDGGSGGAGAGPTGSNGYDQCYSDADCAPLVCRVGVCVSPEDERPPEQEQSRTFQRPTASAHYVYALSPDADSVAVIDPLTLRIEAVLLPEEPLDLAVLPGQDAVVILSRRGEALSLLSTVDGQSRLVTQRTGRRFPRVALSPDGRFAILWTPDGQAPDAGAEGIVAVVDVAALAAGNPVAPVERAAGRRHTDVVFRTDGSTTEDAVLVGKDELAVIELDSLDSQLTPDRTRLPDTYTDVLSREAIGTSDGRYVLLRSFVSPELAIFDVVQRTLGTLTLPGTATDLDISPDGRLVVAALRASSQVAWLRIPDALGDPGEIRVLPVAGVVPGQVELSADGRFAVVFTNSEDSEVFGWLDLAAANPQVEVFGWLNKWVQSIGIAPDARTAIVLHRPNAGSTVSDIYERQVDADEGYSVVDLESGYAQLKLTSGVPPQEFVFAADGHHAAVTLRRDVSAATGATYRVDAIDLVTLVTDSLELASAPQFAGALPPSSPEDDDRIWVTQDHPAGRISFVDLGERSVRTATGYELNADIE